VARFLLPLFFESRLPDHGVMRSLTRCSLAVLLLAFAAPPALAQLIPGWDTKQFALEQIDADTVRLMREVEVNGAGTNAGQQIFADELLWNRRTGEFTAAGNVTMTSPTARLSADRVVFNTKTGHGTFYNASGQASLGQRGAIDKSMFGALEPDIMFAGETIEKIDVDKYRITNGWFTTCVQPTPRWQIVTGTATINLEDYAILKNAVVRVKDVPVFYLPVMYYPIQSDDRATGFLLPTYGSSLYRGQSLSNAFFWAINRSQDLTLFHDWYTKTGQGTGGEYRYVLAPGSEGTMRSYWLWQKAADYDLSGGGTTAVPEGRSYQLNGSLTQVLPGRLRARARVEYFSSLQTQQLYNQNFYDASQRQRTIDGSVAGTWGNLNTTTTFQRRELFTSQTASTVTGYAPSLAANLSSKRLGALPFYVSATSEASNILYKFRNESSEIDSGLRRFDTTPTFRAALSNWPFLTINGSIAYRYTYYSESLDAQRVQVPVPVTRKYFDLKADIVGPVFSRVFNPNNAIADRLKHIIEPNVSIQRITDFESLQNIVPTTSQYDTVIPGTTRVNYGLTNRFLVRKAPKDPNASPGSSAPRELLSVGLTQSYYTDSRASQFDNNYQSSCYLSNTCEPSNFSPVALTARASPTALTSATVRLEFNQKDGALQRISANGTSNHRRVQVAAGWSKTNLQTYSDDAINAATTLNLLGGRTGGSYILNWDIQRGYIQQQRWIGFYNAQCCGLTLEYQEYDIPSSLLLIPKDRRFNLSFTLAGIGSFSNFFGAFGGRTY
jgi:LPS-assembly protein